MRNAAKPDRAAAQGRSAGGDAWAHHRYRDAVLPRRTATTTLASTALRPLAPTRRRLWCAPSNDPSHKSITLCMKVRDACFQRFNLRLVCSDEALSSLGTGHNDRSRVQVRGGTTATGATAATVTARLQPKTTWLPPSRCLPQ
mmetsp:Transcript_30570/g.66162  ORF Transcript_30570/g.66162 Transcript_30570/m.66162 type:complete len:143 (+) Transcript_30570:388-816(+)